MKIYSRSRALVAKTYRTIVRLLMWHPYRASVGALIASAAFWAATIVDALLSGWVNVVLLNASSIAVMVTLPYAVVAHLVRRWDKKAEAAAILAQLDADELAAHNQGFNSLRAAYEAPTMIIPRVPMQATQTYQSERYTPYGELAYQLRCEINESTGDLKA